MGITQRRGFGEEGVPCRYAFETVAIVVGLIDDDPFSYVLSRKIIGPFLFVVLRMQKLRAPPGGSQGLSKVPSF